MYYHNRQIILSQVSHYIVVRGGILFSEGVMNLLMKVAAR